MRDRFNITDIVVGVGMCAIAVGALLVFMVANGLLHGPAGPLLAAEDSLSVPGDQAGLQPLLGQAIVNQAWLEARSSIAIADAAALLNTAAQAQRELESLPGGPLGAAMRFAGGLPAEHAAWVQTVMGRAIVNFTKRGMREGLISADQEDSAFNVAMINKVEAMGARLDRAFVDTWQGTIGRAIVDAIQSFTLRHGATQGQLGRAIVNLAQTQLNSEESWSANQYQLASLALTTSNPDVTGEQGRELLVATAAAARAGVAASPASWPGIPMGVLVVALFALAAVYLGGLVVTAAARDARAMAEMKRHAERWAFRPSA